MNCSSPLAASGGLVHAGHHDGRAGGDGLRRPAAEPAAAEETQLQPAGRGERAGSDDRQRLVRNPLLTEKRWREKKTTSTYLPSSSSVCDHRKTFQQSLWDPVDHQTRDVCSLTSTLKPHISAGSFGY